MIKKLSAKEAGIIYEVINKAAHAYRGIIPDDCYHEPYMPEQELHHEIAVMTFFGWHEGDKVVGVMGFQRVKDVTLVRHAYVLPEYQRKGIGTKLLSHVKQMTKTRQLLVGTWADAVWAIRFYQKHGFKLMPEKDELLKKYWNIPQRQIETSVVLGSKYKTRPNGHELVHLNHLHVRLIAFRHRKYKIMTSFCYLSTSASFIVQQKVIRLNIKS